MSIRLLCTPVVYSTWPPKPALFGPLKRSLTNRGFTSVRPHREHTELEEELHDKAHIDYDRVAIIPNPSVASLYEDALVYETGTAITSTGALTAYSGAKTGRSPLDKRIVKEETSEKDIWYVFQLPCPPSTGLHSTFPAFRSLHVLTSARSLGGVQ